MTPSSKTNHVPLEDLAAHAAGDLSASASTAVVRHVTRCEACRADLAAIERTTAELDDVPELAIPLRAAVLLKRAVAQERAMAASAPPPAQAPPTPPVAQTPVAPVAPPVPVTPPTPTVQPPMPVQPPAAATPAPPPVAPPVPPSAPVAPPMPPIVQMPPAVQLPQVDQRPLATTGPGRERPEIMELSAGADMLGRERQRRRKLPALLAVAAVIVAGVAAGGAYLQLTKDDTDTPLATRQAATKTFTSGAEYSPSTIKTIVPGLLKDQPPSGAAADAKESSEVATLASPPADAAAGTAPLQMSIERLKTDEALRQCLDSLTAEPGQPAIAIDYANFVDPTGQRSGPALIVVLAFKDDPNQVDVFVVGPRCSRGDADLYYFERVARS